MLTKQDYVLGSLHAERVEKEFDGIVDALINRHGIYFGDIERFIVAASPKDSTKLKRGDGVDRLLLFLLRADAPQPSVHTEKIESLRMIDLLDRNRKALV